MVQRLLCLVLFLCACNALARDKTDLVTLLNGNVINGEIKEMGHGQLSLSTESMGTVRVEWNDITHARSQYEFQLELSDGTRYYGTVSENETPGYIVVQTYNESVPLLMSQIVRITPIENTFWDQLRGSLSLGLNVTKNENIADSFNVAASATHRTRKRSFGVKLNSIVSEQNGQTSQRAELSGQLTSFRSNRWFNSYLVGVETNDELALDIRSSIGAGFGRYLIQSNTSEMQALVGIVGTAEEFQGDTDSLQSVEGMLGVAFSKYLYDHPNVDIDLSLNVFPSFTQSGRLRAQLDARIRRELLEDLFLDLSLYVTYDKDPQSQENKTTDHGIVTSLGWSF